MLYFWVSLKNGQFIYISSTSIIKSKSQEENEKINRDVNVEDIPDSIGSDGLEPEPDE